MSCKTTKGKIAWLITWEGSEAQDNGRCKIVAILPPQVSEKSIKAILRVLYCSEANLTLCDKMGFITPNRKDPFFREGYRNINPEFWYGHYFKEYLCARKVKQLRCEESNRDFLESTLYWREYSKYIFNPDIDPNAPTSANPSDLLKKVMGERDVSYTFSIRPQIEEEKERRTRRKQFGN